MWCHVTRSRSAPPCFGLSEEDRAFRRVVRGFAEAEIAPFAADWDATHHFPVDAVLKMGELGLFGLPFPEEYGGAGADFLTLCIAIEEIARVDSSMAITLEAAVGLGAGPIFHFGSEEQKRRWLPDLAAAAFGLTEPDAGSDAGGTLTRAVLDGDEWVIDGAKSFITNSGTEITSLVNVTARTGGGGISTIIVPAGTPGFVVEPAYRKMGWHASDTHGLRFEGCRVPQENLLGELGSRAVSVGIADIGFAIDCFTTHADEFDQCCAEKPRIDSRRHTEPAMSTGTGVGDLWIYPLACARCGRQDPTSCGRNGLGGQCEQRWTAHDGCSSQRRVAIRGRVPRTRTRTAPEYAYSTTTRG